MRFPEISRDVFDFARHDKYGRAAMLDLLNLYEQAISEEPNEKTKNGMVYFPRWLTRSGSTAGELHEITIRISAP